jgi:hypothetical protein
MQLRYITLMAFRLAPLVLPPLALALAASALPTGWASAQSLTVSREDRIETVTAAEFAALPRVHAEVTQHDQSHEFEGVALASLAAKVGVDVSKPLQGRDLAAAIRVTAADGYQVVLALSEIDPATRRGAVILADRDRGKPLDAANGPFRLVVSDDIRPARSARQVTRIEILDLASSTKRPPAR